MPRRTHYARARDGVAIAYQVVGDGPRDIVYVPQSFTAIDVLWEHPIVAGYFERLAAIGRLTLFDRRGSGASDRCGGPATLEEQIDDVRAVMDAVSSEKAVLFAIMESGPMAMLFAASMPDRVEALLLYAAFARTTRTAGYEFAWMKEERDAAMESLLENWGDGSIGMRFAPS